MIPFLNIERDGGIVTLTLNRPEKRNAISTRAECEEVEAACRTLSRDDGVRCVIVTGAGSAFCAGGGSRQYAQAIWPSDWALSGCAAAIGRVCRGNLCRVGRCRCCCACRGSAWLGRCGL